MDVYPLIFEPIFKPKIWGGRTLESLLNKNLPPDSAIGESWEIADLEEDQSVVNSGSAKGITLGALVKDWGRDLIGNTPLFEGRFPLLIKFLDAVDSLSVQVHPDQAMAKRLGGCVRVKNEAWYILDAKSDGFIYRGVREGVNAAALQQAINDKQVESVLEHIRVRKGECYYLPSGTIHALGAGVTVAEVQTPSDITYRVYDWDRIDATTGQPRELHLEQALECISYETGPIAEERIEHAGSISTTVTSLVRSQSFVIERVRMAEGTERPVPFEEMMIWIVLEGTGDLGYGRGSDPVPFAKGDTVLFPAGLTDAQVKTTSDCQWLEVSIPIPSNLAGFPRPEREKPQSMDAAGGGFTPLGVPKK